MRIITGKFKGRIIKMPKGIRPTQDKVRKALFDILGDIKGMSFIELYAGSGAVGLEALSQGASRVVFVEKDRAHVKIIKNNLSALGLGDEQAGGLACYWLIEMDAGRAIERLQQKKEEFDIIFLDPPYYQSLAPRFGSTPLIVSRSVSKDAVSESLSKKTLKILSRCDIVSACSLVVCQHFKKDILPESAGNLILIKQAKYGDTLLSFYRKTDSRKQV
ncbi:MAG: 16S rRNA (guanine(966)-N(2))-methyltransferase RsmD [Candidatus Omnitrophica bacterium]|nr:16S rRNA (guanine(966)-N(2))-methyltransferase RsmD [Candidatus Omnitrophota bacterium]